VYDGYRRSKGLPTRSVAEITQAEVREIYRRQYWDAIRGDRLPSGIDVVVFDGAVNSGPTQATKWLQRALGVRVDGDLGEATIAAACAHPDPARLIDDICRRRLGMLQSLRTWSTFGRGWSRRIASVRAIGHAWAVGAAAPPPAPAHDEAGNAKGYVTDVALPPADEDAGVKTTVGGAGLGAAVQGAQQTLEPLVGQSRTVASLYAVLTVLGVMVAIGGLAYAWWANRCRKRAEMAYTAEAVADLDEVTG
jgi:lysozyme family protein